MKKIVLFLSLLFSLNGKAQDTIRYESHKLLYFENILTDSVPTVYRNNYVIRIIKDSVSFKVFADQTNPPFLLSARLQVIRPYKKYFDPRTGNRIYSFDGIDIRLGGDAIIDFLYSVEDMLLQVGISGQNKSALIFIIDKPESQL